MMQISTNMWGSTTQHGNIVEGNNLHSSNTKTRRVQHQHVALS